MNAGLGSLAVLKAHLLADALRSRTTYDTQLTLIGQGVAGMMERHCDRKLGRVVSDVFICTADRIQVFAGRYPIESIATVHYKGDSTSGWVLQTGLVTNTNDDSGLIYWGTAVGPEYAHLKFTYTGGLWFDATEDASDTLPSGATALPAELQHAWILQCRSVWAAVDKLGKDIVSTGSSSTKAGEPLATLDLIPEVKTILDGYARFQIT